MHLSFEVALVQGRLAVVLQMTAVLLFGLGCMNPTASVQPDVEKFKSQKKEQIVVLKDSERDIGFAWAGDPTLRPLVLVHGSPGSWEGWAHFLMDTDLQRKFHIIALDRPGFGLSAGSGAERSLQRQAEAVHRVLATNRSQLPAILVGHSFGGPVIGKFAMDYSAEVAALVFVASSVAPQFEEVMWYQDAATWWPFRWLVPKDLRVCNEEIMALKKELEDMEPAWSKISQPVIVVHGDADPLVPIGNVDFLAKHLSPDIVLEIVRVPRLNHFVPWKRPDLIFSAVKKIEAKLVEVAANNQRAGHRRPGLINDSSK